MTQTHEDVVRIFGEMYERTKHGSSAPLKYPILRQVAFPPDAASRARMCTFRPLSLPMRTQSDYEKYARDRDCLEGISRLLIGDHHVRDTPSHFEVVYSQMFFEMRRNMVAALTLEGADQRLRLTEGDASTMMHRELRHLWVDSRLRLRSNPVFVRPSRGLVHRLLLTDTKKVLGSQVRFPFPAFNVFLPPGMMYLHHDDSGEHEVTHMTLAEDVITTEFVMEVIGARLFAAAQKAGLLLPRPARTLLITLHGKEGSRSPSPVDVCNAMFTVTLPDDDEVQVIKQPGTMRIYGSILDDSGSSALISGLAVNLLLYITSTQDLHLENAAAIEKLARQVKRAKKGKPSRGDIRRLERARAHTIYDTGTAISIDPALETALREGVSPRDRWSLTYKTLVRGHWRNQACGAGRRDRKTIWIAPHTRGPDFADKVATHTYTTR